MQKIILIIIGIFIVVYSNAQNTILLLDGKTILTNDYRIEKEKGILWYKNKRSRIKPIDIYDIFSIVDSAKKETLLYRTDNEDHELTTVQMRYFISGESHARLNYKNPNDFFYGFAIGAGAPLVLSYISEIALVVSPLVPAGYNTYKATRPIRKSKMEKFIPDEYKNNMHFRNGFEQIAGQKRLKRSLLGSGIGLSIGFAFVLLFYN